MNTQNPILKNSQFPNNAIDFNSIKEEHFIPALEEAISLAKQKIQSIKSHSQVTFENSIVALEEAAEEVSFVHTLFHNLLLANGNEKMQELSEELNPWLPFFTMTLI